MIVVPLTTQSPFRSIASPRRSLPVFPDWQTFSRSFGMVQKEPQPDSCAAVMPVSRPAQGLVQAVILGTGSLIAAVFFGLALCGPGFDGQPSDGAGSRRRRAEKSGRGRAESRRQTPSRRSRRSKHAVVRTFGTPVTRYTFRPCNNETKLWPLPQAEKQFHFDLRAFTSG